MTPKLIPAASDEGQKLNALYTLAKEIRGTLIDQAIWADALVTDILTHHFCSDPSRQPLLRSDVLTGRDATFSGRLDVLDKVVHRTYPDFLKSHEKLFTTLAALRRLRNRLAHSHLDTSDAFMAKGYTDRIQLVFFEDGAEKTQVITVPEFNERLKECSRAISALAELQSVVLSNQRCC